MATVSQPTITVIPSLTTTIDQKVDVTVSNLSPEEYITLRARTIDNSKIVFESFAYYMADKNGEVSVSSQPSMGGTYTGVEPMGLFWSMKPVTTSDRDDLFRKRDVTTPLKVTLDVCSGHSQGQPEEKASLTLLRSYMGPGVTRHFIQDYGFYGTLFLPVGDGPFPGTFGNIINLTKDFGTNYLGK